MTIRRIEYTSCEDGVEGIAGFQVRAISPQVPGPLREAALRDSVYEPGPGLPSMPTAEQLARFPVALGYALAEPGLVLYRSNYVGRDHTGRWGNYFAQALTLDRSAELDGMLPIDLWQSPLWLPQSTRSGELPVMPAASLQATGTAGPEATEQFLAVSGRAELLATALSAARVVAAGDRGRLVIVTDDSTAAAFWISAITRSLPRASAMALSFTTYTARPESHRALLACTTPDVDVPTYGDYQLLDLSSAGRAPEPAGGDYDRIVAEIWAEQFPGRLIEAAQDVSPPLRGAELDSFARLFVLFENYPVTIDWTEADVLNALEFAAARVPGALFAPWDRVVGTVRELGGPQDAVRWSAVLAPAVERDAPVPGPLLRSYVQAAVAAMVSGSAQAPVWLPELDERVTRDLAENVLVPAVLHDPTPRLLDWLAQPAHAQVCEQVLGTLDERLAAPGNLEKAVGALSGPAAEFVVAKARRRPLLKTCAQVALARDGKADPVQVLVSAPPELFGTPQEWQELVSLLWPAEPPSPSQATRLLTDARPAVLQAAGLPDQFVERLIEDSTQGALSPDDVALAGRLAKEPFRDFLGIGSRPTVDAVQIFGYFSGKPGESEAAANFARNALNLGEHVNPQLIDQLYAVISTWLMTLDWQAHRELLAEFADRDRRFFPAFRTTADRELAGLAPDSSANLITAWRSMPRSQSGARMSKQLLDQVMPHALARSGRRHLDRIGECLPEAADLRGALGTPPPRDDWQAWWRAWRGKHEKQGLFSRLMSPKSGRER